jgi:DNA-binding NarL/FixJ family response regulator
MITVLLADDHPLIRKGFRLILDAEPDIEVAGEAGDGATAVSMCAELRPDVVLMDVRMPGRDGIAGASGFLLKDTQPDSLAAAIRTIAAGDAVLAPAATRRLIRQFTTQQAEPPSSSRRAAQIQHALTSREQDVFSLIAAGMSNSEIAARLHLSEGTVKIHVGRILAKLGLRDRVQAVVLAYESTLIIPGTIPPSRPGDPH